MGKPSRWFSAEQLRNKFDDCAGLVFPRAQLDAIFRTVRSLDGDIPVAALCDVLRTDAGFA